MAVVLLCSKWFGSLSVELERLSPWVSYLLQQI
jgi:hypothetical protein